MRKLRDIIYINADLKNKTFTYYGIDFKEFIEKLLDNEEFLIKHTAKLLTINFVYNII